MLESQPPNRARATTVAANLMDTADLTGRDLAYWVARANAHGSQQERHILLRHYGAGTPTHEPSAESSMRAFVQSKIGATLPPRATWR